MGQEPFGYRGQPLKTIQRRVNKWILSGLGAHGTAHGFLKGKSIITNAQAHQGARYLFALDIKDASGSVTGE